MRDDVQDTKCCVFLLKLQGSGVINAESGLEKLLYHMPSAG